MAPPPVKTSTTTTSYSGASKSQVSQVQATTWGRSLDVDSQTIGISALIMTVCPLLVLYFQIAIDQFHGAFLGPVVGWISATPPKWALPAHQAPETFLNMATYGRIVSTLPSFTVNACTLLMGWIAFQAALYLYLPSKVGLGQQTPAGHILKYKVNGLKAWVVTHVLFLVFSTVVPLFKGSVIADQFRHLYLAANVYGYLLTAFCFLKAHKFPTHPDDRKFSNSWIYDLYMGIEFNPRIGEWFDFKLFHNGRPGIVAWTLISYSFAVQQYYTHGFVTNSMVLVNLFHAIYVVDFFYYEDWYLRTIDICHDHFGFYLSWGDTVWLPFMYTLQGHYLAVNPVQLSAGYTMAIGMLGISGYTIFRQVNNQKDVVRLTNGECLIWGRKPQLIRPKYKTSDGVVHDSILLVSGWWGMARHVNYLGDLVLSLSMCLACGTEHLTPYFYIVFMAILLVGRIYRDDARCRGKYGKFWEQYCDRVPYKLIPYVW